MISCVSFVCWRVRMHMPIQQKLSLCQRFDRNGTNIYRNGTNITLMYVRIPTKSPVRETLRIRRLAVCTARLSRSSKI